MSMTKTDDDHDDGDADIDMKDDHHITMLVDDMAPGHDHESSW